MQCLQATELMSLRLDGAIGADDELCLRQHLVDCGACADEWEQMRRAHLLLAHVLPAAPPPMLAENVMAAVRRRRQFAEFRRAFLLFCLIVPFALVLCAVPILFAAGQVASDLDLVQSIVGTLVRIVDIAQSMAGALALVLRTLVGGMNWILVPAAIAVVLGMLMVWWSLVRVPTRLAWRRVGEQA